MFRNHEEKSIDKRLYQLAIKKRENGGRIDNNIPILLAGCGEYRFQLPSGWSFM